jgi:hypothetical protein
VTDIRPVHERRFFKLEEARKLLSILMRITKSADERVQSRVSHLSQTKSSGREELEKIIHAEYHHWEEKVSRLGGVAKGMWLVDFDSGEGYYCWQFPETEIDHFHGYEDGFLGRARLNGKSTENHPPS